LVDQPKIIQTWGTSAEELLLSRLEEDAKTRRLKRAFSNSAIFFRQWGNL